MTPNVPTIDIGTATAGTAAARPLRRKRYTTPITRTMAMMSVQLGVVQGGADGGRAIGGESDVEIGRQRRFESRNRRAHVIDGRDDVRARLAEDDHQHRRLAVGQAQVSQVRHRILDVGDVLEPQRVAVAVGDDEVPVVGGVIGLVVGIDLPALRRRYRPRPWARWRWRWKARSGRPRGRRRNGRAPADRARLARRARPSR